MILHLEFLPAGELTLDVDGSNYLDTRKTCIK
jgi:hypothetical protein